MKLKIISDGRPHGVKIVDTATGAELEDIVKVHVNMDAADGGIPRAEITLMGVPVELVAEDIKFRPHSMTGFFGE